MRAALVAACVLAAPSCKSVECGPGTFEENGVCVPADNTVNPAACGPFTQLVGGQCVPMFPPTVCDDTSTLEELDVTTGVTTCIGSGIGFACPQPAPGTQTICGQLFDLETGAAFSDPGAQCTPCGAPTATGVCSLELRALDAVKFGMNPMDPTAVLTTGAIYLDDCGRYRIPDIVLPTNPFVGIGIDDAAMAMRGPGGTTNAIGLATPAVPNLALKDFEAFVAPASTTTKWATNGPPISGGMFVAIFRAARTGTANQAGVTILRQGAPIPGDDFYFTAGETTRETIDGSANATGANGTALVTNAMLDGYIGAGGLPAECIYEGHAGVSLPFVLFVQIFRPTDASGQTCPL